MKKILYVEDDTINALIVEKLLQKSHEVKIAKDDITCLDLVQKHSFNAILMDINLGDEKLGGVEVMRKLRKIPSLNGTPILAVTAFALPEDRKRFLEMGFDDYLSKPIDEAILKQTLKHHTS